MEITMKLATMRNQEIICIECGNELYINPRKAWSKREKQTVKRCVKCNTKIIIKMVDEYGKKGRN